MSSSLWGDFSFDTDGFLTNYISIHTKIKTSWLGSFAGGFFQFFCHFFTLSCVKLGKWKTVATSKLSILKAETCISIRGSSKACICWPRRVSRSYKLRLTRSEYWYHEGCSKGWKKGIWKDTANLKEHNVLNLFYSGSHIRFNSVMPLNT